MELIVALEHRFCRAPDGTVWTQTMFAYRFWRRYLEVFDDVTVVARTRDVDSPPPGWIRADGSHVAFTPIPYYIGPWQYARRALAVHRAARAAVDPSAAVLLRVPSRVGTDMMARIRQTGQPFGVEVVADPYDVFAPGANSHPLRALFRHQASRTLRRQVHNAVAASYVTSSALQRRYPSGVDAYSSHFSDVELDDAAYVDAPRERGMGQRRFRLVTVATLAQFYKRVDILIDATAHLVQAGRDVELYIIGDGRHRTELQQQAKRVGLADRVEFLGQITAGMAVRMELDQSDLFVMSTRQEGLPRAMVEAMARGLPCVGTMVGGIPELLSSEDLVPPDDVMALAAKLEYVLDRPEVLADMSARNLRKAQEYREEELRTRRIAFYRALRERTENWIRQEHNLSSLT